MNIKVMASNTGTQFYIVPASESESYINIVGRKHGSCAMWPNSAILYKIKSGDWIVISHNNPFSRKVGGV